MTKEDIKKVKSLISNDEFLQQISFYLNRRTDTIKSALEYCLINKG